MTVHNHFDAATQKVTIFSPKGEAVECTRLNAIDLIRTSGFEWRAPSETVIPEEVVAESVEQVTPAPQAEDKPAAIDAELPQIDHTTAPLVDIAVALTGSDDVEKYLTGFTADALRTMAEDRYQEKVHHKSSQETVIEKIMGFEEAKVDSEMDQ